MKRDTIFRRTVLLALTLLLASCALANSMNTIFPPNDLWGVSRDDFKQAVKGSYKTITVDKNKTLTRTGIEMDGYALDAYFVFGYSTWDASGYTYKGLSKVVYLLTDYSGKLDKAYKDLVASMTDFAGKPASAKKSVTTWNAASCKIEIGKGKFKKYSGSDKTNVAIVFTATNLTHPVTPPPTAEPTPKYVYVSPTPRPTKTPKPAKQRTAVSGGSYVLNTKSMVFHYRSCYDVDKMDEENKAFSNASRSELISQGYRPCGHCDP